MGSGCGAYDLVQGLGQNSFRGAGGLWFRAKLLQALGLMIWGLGFRAKPFWGLGFWVLCCRVCGLGSSMDPLDRPNAQPGKSA